MKDAILILSGGVDSTTMLYEFRERIAFAVSFHYGSNHNDREIACAKWHCAHLGIKHLVITLPFMKEYFHSSLLSGADAVPEGNYNEENMRSTVVPFRNGIMLSIAAGLAENEGLKYVMMANHSGDHAIYPDCTPEFAAAMSAATKTGTANGVELFAPYTNLTKTDIVKKGVKLGVDYEKTWSCYKGGKEPCGVCGTCREREEAFKAAGVKIPVKPKKDNKDKK